MKNPIIFFVIISFFLSCQNKKAELSDANLASEQDKMEWWRDARFGLFIHWGLYAVPAGEWKGEEIPGISEWIMYNAEIPVLEYEALTKDFNPVKFNADEWVQLAKNAGMKYIVITSKHHDGFAMYHSKASKYNIVDATPFDRDPLKELAEACKKHGIKLGFYHSQAQDWNHPGGTYATWRKDEYWDKSIDRVPLDTYIDEKVVPQVTEILTEYGDIAIMWWDTPVGMTEEAAQKLQKLLELQPGIVENNRLYGPWNGDFSTPEQHIPPTGLDYDWEVCMTMNTSWGYKHYDHNWKSNETLIQYLTDITSKGGNFLLNVGPTAEGLIPQPSIERLKAMGEWMDKNSESIYGTTASPFFKLPWGRCTKKVEGENSILYFHIFNFPVNNQITIPGLKNKILSIESLVEGKKLEYTIEGDDVQVNLAGILTDPANTVIKMKIEGNPDVTSNMPKQDAAGKVVLPAYTSFIHNSGYGDHADLSSMEKDAFIDNWIDPSSRLEFMFELLEAGNYTLYIEGMTEMDTVKFQISSGENAEELVFLNPAEDGFSEVASGTFNFIESGLKTINLKPHPKGWKDFKLRKITLIK